GTGTLDRPCADLREDGWNNVREVQAGNIARFEDIYRQHAAMIHRYLLKQTGDLSLAQDLTSETFMKALLAIRTLSFQGRPVRSWLITIARNLSLDHFKAFRTRYVFPVEVDTLVDRREQSPGPEDLAVAGELCVTVRSALAELSEPQRECLTLRFLGGLSVAETASEMNKTSEAVRAIQHRALRKLSAVLADDGTLDLAS
ncbi:MAG: RNA polymerase sigma factor, partial [Pseudonocardiaceae bacterium]